MTNQKIINPVVSYLYGTVSMSMERDDTRKPQSAR